MAAAASKRGGEKILQEAEGAKTRREISCLDRMNERRGGEHLASAKAASFSRAKMKEARERGKIAPGVLFSTLTFFFRVFSRVR